MHEKKSRLFVSLLACLALTAAMACSSNNKNNAPAANNAPAVNNAPAAPGGIASPSAASATRAPASATSAVAGTAAATGGNVAVPASVVAADKALAQAAGSGSPVDQVSITSPVTITFWHVSSDSSAAGKKLAALIQDFESKNPNIKVNAQYVGNYNDLFQKLQTAIAGGQTPDLAVAYEDQTAQYQTANVVVPLDDYIKSKMYGLTPDDYNDIFQAYRYDNLFAAYKNQMLSFPWTKSVELMYYNMDQLQAAGLGVPQTWDDFVKAAAATTKGDVKGYAIGIDASRLVTQEYTRGGALLSDDQKKAVFNNQQGVDALSMYQQMVKAGTAYQIAKAFDDQNDFAAGKTTFNFGSSAGLPFYQQAIQQGGVVKNWGAALPPHAPGQQPATDMYGANVSMFKSTPQKQLAAWLFIKYFTSKDVNPDWSVSTGYLPIRASGINDPRVQQQIAALPGYKAAVDAQQYGRPEPNVRQWDDIRTDIQDAMVAAISDPTKSAKSLLDDAVNKANQQLSQ